MEKPHRRPWRWIVAGAGTFLLLLVGLLAFRRDPYSFLYRFHPRIVDVDLARAFGAPPPGTKGAPVILRPKITMLVFKTEDANRVLRAMKAELTPERGFSSRQFTGAPNDVDWDFIPGSLPPSRSVTVLNGEAKYSYGNSAGFEEQMFEKGPSNVTPIDAPEKPACIVVIVRNRNWLDRSLDLVRAVLHVG